MIVQPRTQSFPTSLLTALCRQQTGNLLRYIYIYYGASILMHQIVQFLKLLTNLTIQKWTFSVHCVTGRKKDSSLWRKPPTVNCAESVFFRFRKIPQTRKRHLPLLPRLPSPAPAGPFAVPLVVIAHVKTSSFVLSKRSC